MVYKSITVFLKIGFVVLGDSKVFGSRLIESNPILNMFIKEKWASMNKGGDFWSLKKSTTSAKIDVVVRGYSIVIKTNLKIVFKVV